MLTTLLMREFFDFLERLRRFVEQDFLNCLFASGVELELLEKESSDEGEVDAVDAVDASQQSDGICCFGFLVGRRLRREFFFGVVLLLLLGIVGVALLVF